MRKVYYGAFTSKPLPEWDPDLPIGVHNILRRYERESLNGAGYEYYITYKGHSVVIDDATIVEKILARIKFLFKYEKRMIVGSIDLGDKDKIIVGNGVYTHSIKTKTNKNGKTVIDEAHYKETLEKGKEYQDQRERKILEGVLKCRRSEMKDTRESEVERLKLGGISSELLKLPIIQDIIDYELCKAYYHYDGKVEPKWSSGTRAFSVHKEENKIVIKSATKDLENGKSFDPETYSIIRIEDGYIIEVGNRNKLCPDGLRIYADCEGNMTKAEFKIGFVNTKHVTRIIDLPMSKPCIDGLKQYIEYQRELEEIAARAEQSYDESMESGDFSKSKDYRNISFRRTKVWLEVVKQVEKSKQYNPMKYMYC